MEDGLSRIARARLASGMTIEDARSVVGLTYQPYKDREEDPSRFTLGELSRLTSAMNKDGKHIVRAWLLSFFGL